MDDLKLYAKNRAEIESLINTVRIYSEDISMEFGFDKCASMGMRRGRIAEMEGIELQDGNLIRSLGPDQNYKYLGILEAADLLHTEMKSKTQTEYFRRLRKILKSKLNSGNTIKAVNSWAVPVIRYNAGILDWTRAEIQGLDRKIL